MKSKPYREVKALERIKYLESIKFCYIQYPSKKESAKLESGFVGTIRVQSWEC